MQITLFQPMMTVVAVLFFYFLLSVGRRTLHPLICNLAAPACSMLKPGLAMAHANAVLSPTCTRTCCATGGYLTPSTHVGPPAGYDTFIKALDEGIRERAVAATAANATSSRSHTIVTLDVVQTQTNAETGQVRRLLGLRTAPGAGAVVFGALAGRRQLASQLFSACIFLVSAGGGDHLQNQHGGPRRVGEGRSNWRSREETRGVTAGRRGGNRDASQPVLAVSEWAGDRQQSRDPCRSRVIPSAFLFRRRGAPSTSR